MTFHIAFRTTLLTGCDRFNHFLQLTPLLELEKVFGSRLTGRETFPFVSKKKQHGKWSKHMKLIWNKYEIMGCEVIKKNRINLLMPLSPYRFFFFLIVLQAICTYHNQRGLCTCGRHPKNHFFSFHWPRAFIPLLQKRFLEQTHRSHM